MYLINVPLYVTGDDANGTKLFLVQRGARWYVIHAMPMVRSYQNIDPKLPTPRVGAYMTPGHCHQCSTD